MVIVGRGVMVHFGVVGSAQAGEVKIANMPRGGVLVKAMQHGSGNRWGSGVGDEEEKKVKAGF